MSYGGKKVRQGHRKLRHNIVLNLLQSHCGRDKDERTNYFFTSFYHAKQLLEQN